MNRVEFESWKNSINEAITIAEESIADRSAIKGDVGTHNNRTPDQVKAMNDRKATLRDKAVNAINKVKETASKVGSAVKQGARDIAQKTANAVINKAKETLSTKKPSTPIGLSSFKDNKEPATVKPGSMADKFAKGIDTNKKPEPTKVKKSKAEKAKADLKANFTKTHGKEDSAKDDKGVNNTKSSNSGVGLSGLNKQSDDKKKLRSSMAQKLKHGAKKMIHGVVDTKHKIEDAKRFVKDTYKSRDEANKRARGIKDEKKPENKTEPKAEEKKVETKVKASEEPKEATHTTSKSSGNGGTTININVRGGDLSSRVKQAKERAKDISDTHKARNEQAEADKKSRDEQNKKDREDYFNKINNKDEKDNSTQANAEEKKETKKSAKNKTEAKDVNKKAKEALKKAKEAKKDKVEKVNKEKAQEVKQEAKEQKAKEMPKKIIDPKVDKPASEEEMKGMNVKKLAAGDAKGSNTLQHKKTKGKEASMYDDEKGKPVPATPADKPKNEDGERTSAKAIVKKKDGETKKVEVKTEPKAEETKADTKVENKSEETKEVKTENKSEDTKPTLDDKAKKAKAKGKGKIELANNIKKSKENAKSDKTKEDGNKDEEVKTSKPVADKPEEKKEAKADEPEKKENKAPEVKSEEKKEDKADEAENKEDKTPEEKKEDKTENKEAKADLDKRAEKAKQTGKKELTPEESAAKRAKINAKLDEQRHQKDLARMNAMKYYKGGHEDTRSDEQREKDNKDIMGNENNPNHVKSPYRFDSLDGSTDTDENGRKVQDGKPVDKEKFYKTLHDQNKKIDNETDAEKAKRNAGDTRARSVKDDTNKKAKAKSEGEKKTDTYKFIDSVLKSEDEEPSDEELNKIERKTKKK